MGRVSASRPNTEGEGMMLPFQVFPACSGHDAGYLGTAYSELFGQLIASPAIAPERDDFFGLIVRQFCRTVLLAFEAGAAGTALIFHILHVVVMCADEKMIRPYTSAIVALVKDVHPLRDWAVMDFPTNPMGFKHRCAVWRRYDSIASLVLGRLPLPTPRPFLNVTPKPLFESTPFTRHEKHSYNYGQSQERDILLSVTANSVAALRDVSASPEQLVFLCQL